MRYFLYIIFLGTILSEDIKTSKAPGFYARNIDGRGFYFSEELGRGNNVFLSFFTTWCEPCKLEIPVLDSLQKKFPETKFYLINVSGLELEGKKMKESSKKVREFIDMLDVSIPVLMDKYGKIANLYDALTLPKSVVIDSSGNIVHSHVGFVPGDEKKLVEALESLGTK